MKRSQLAINTASLRCEDLPADLAAIRAAGFAKVEFSLAQVHEYLQRGGAVAALQTRLKELDLQTIGGFRNAVISFASAAEIAENRERILADATILKELGAHSLVAGCDAPNSGQLDLAALEKIAASFAAVAHSLARFDVDLLLEFNWGPVKSIATARRVCEMTRAENVGILFDPAHYYFTPAKAEMLTPELVGWIRHVHVDNMRAVPPEYGNCNADRVLPGDPQGCLDLGQLFGAIESGGYAGDFSIEMFSQELWSLPIDAAAQRMYQSLLPLTTGE